MKIFLILLLLSAEDTIPRGEIFELQEGSVRGALLNETISDSTPVVLRGRIDTKYKGDTLYYFWEDKTILLIGNAEIETKEIRASADTIKYQSSKDIVEGYGNPLLLVGEQEITGEKMKYDLTTGEGIIKDGRTKIENGWFDGRLVRKVGPNVLNVDDGKFTTCELIPPHYYFWGKELKVYVDDMAYIRPLVMFVGDIPVFVAPFWWFPIKKGRKSGLLHPKVGRSSDKGRYVENVSYFWVTNDWTDVTFRLDHYELRGQRMFFESRWVHPFIGIGELNSSYIGEEAKKRYSFDISHSQSFPDRLSLIIRGRFLSDLTYKEDYEEDILVQLDKELHSYLSSSKAWNWGYTALVMEERKNLVTEATQRKVPYFSYSIFQKRLFGGNFAYSGNFLNSMDSLNAPYISRLTNNFSYSWPFKLFFLSFSPVTSHSYTYRRPIPLDKSLHSTYSISTSTRIYGRTIFNPQFRHIMMPTITYSLIDTMRSCGFSLGNDFHLMLGEKRYQIATLNLASSWNFINGQLNPVGITSYSSVFPQLSFFGYAKYDYYAIEEKFKYERFSTAYRFSKPNFNLSLTYNLVHGMNQSVWGALSMKLTKNWALGLSRRYDITEKKMIGEGFSLTRDLHCWVGTFSFDKYGTRWKYDFQLRVKELPEIKIEEGLFRMFFE